MLMAIITIKNIKKIILKQLRRKISFFVDRKKVNWFMYISLNERGVSSVWLEYLPVTQGVASSSLVHPAVKKIPMETSGFFIFGFQTTLSGIISLILAASRSPEKGF